MSDLTTAQKLIDELYASGYQDARKERDYDPRGCEEWQVVVDLIEQQQKRIAELAATVERLGDDVERAFYNGYVRGATKEREGTRNHAEHLPEIAEDECRKYLDFEFNSKY